MRAATAEGLGGRWFICFLAVKTLDVEPSATCVKDPAVLRLRRSFEVSASRCAQVTGLRRLIKLGGEEKEGDRTGVVTSAHLCVTVGEETHVLARLVLRTLLPGLLVVAK